MESAAFPAWASHGMAEAALEYTHMLNRTACTAAPDPVACLLAVNASALLAAWGGEDARPLEDGVELMAAPWKLARSCATLVLASKGLVMRGVTCWEGGRVYGLGGRGGG